MNTVTRQYVEDCLNSGSRLRSAATELALPDAFAKSYGQVQLDRPLFVPEKEISSFAADLAMLFDLLVSLPARLFDGDLRRYCTALGMDDRIVELMCRGAGEATPPLYARADAYHDGTAFRLLELNVGSELGGIDSAQVNRAYLNVPAFADFARRHQLGHVDTLSRLVARLRRVAEPVTTDEPVIGLIESNGGLAAHDHVFLAIQEAMSEQGVRLLLGELHELGERNGKVTLRGTPLDVVLRYFVSGELVDDPAGQQTLDTVLRAQEMGRTVLFTPLAGGAFASKASLALLHEPGVRVTLSAGERAVIDRVVPWTRLLSTSPELVGSPPRGDRAELIDRCRTDRENLVLKPGVGYGGVGSVIGHAVTDEQWQRALSDQATGDYVVQQRVRPAGEPVVNAATGTVQDWVANWGIFVDADGYAGGFVRALKPSDGAVVSYSNPGTRGTCVFTFPNEPSHPDNAAK
ncbi:MAG TPA: hypothetical protein VFZ32_02775 [Micromonosporaceae bacterium]